MMPVLIRGPKQPGNDIDVYLRPLVEELLQLWNGNGVRAWGEHIQEEFNLHVLLFVTINEVHPLFAVTLSTFLHMNTRK